MPNGAKLGLFAGITAAVAGGVVWLIKRTRKDPRERERKRRRVIQQNGRQVGGTVIDTGTGMIWYSYSVHGVEYQTAQDVSDLTIALPQDGVSFLGPATIKYLGGNPVDSIVVAEEWSGLRPAIPAERIILLGE